MSKHFWSKNIKKLIQLIIILIFFRLFYDKHDVYAHLRDGIMKTIKNQFVLLKNYLRFTTT